VCSNAVPRRRPITNQPIDLSQRIDAPKGFAVTPGAADLEDGSQKPHGIGALRSGATTKWRRWLRRNRWTGNEPEPGFNPWDKIKGTPDEAEFCGALGTARNERKFNAIKSDIARETRTGSFWTRSRGGWAGNGGAAGVLSPTSLIPGGSFVKGAKGGIALVKAGGGRRGECVSAATAGGDAALGIEQTRTAARARRLSGSSLFLGGLLGAGGQALLSKATGSGVSRHWTAI
jgi:hypothetical protein